MKHQTIIILILTLAIGVVVCLCLRKETDNYQDMMIDNPQIVESIESFIDSTKSSDICRHSNFIVVDIDDPVNGTDSLEKQEKDLVAYSWCFKISIKYLNVDMLYQIERNQYLFCQKIEGKRILLNWGHYLPEQFKLSKLSRTKINRFIDEMYPDKQKMTSVIDSVENLIRSANGYQVVEYRYIFDPMNNCIIDSTKKYLYRGLI